MSIKRRKIKRRKRKSQEVNHMTITKRKDLRGQDQRNLMKRNTKKIRREISILVLEKESIIEDIQVKRKSIRKIKDTDFINFSTNYFFYLILNLNNYFHINMVESSKNTI